MGSICSADRVLIVPKIPASRCLKTFKLNKINVIFIQGDICEEKSDGVINGSDIFMKNKHSRIITRSGTNNLLDEKESNPQPLTLGKAYLSEAGNLNSKYLIHLCIPVWTGGDRNEVQVLKSCFDEAFKIAEENNIKTLSMTDVSSGVFGIPSKISRTTLIEAIISYNQNRNDESGVEEIKVIHHEYGVIKNMVEEFMEKTKTE